MHAVITLFALALLALTFGALGWLLCAIWNNRKRERAFYRQGLRQWRRPS